MVGVGEEERKKKKEREKGKNKKEGKKWKGTKIFAWIEERYDLGKLKGLFFFF